ncbi:hypothetical protein ACET3Z_031066 [Daucus carota]
MLKKEVQDICRQMGSDCLCRATIYVEKELGWKYFVANLRTYNEPLKVTGSLKKALLFSLSKLIHVMDSINLQSGQKLGVDGSPTLEAQYIRDQFRI